GAVDHRIAIDVDRRNAMLGRRGKRRPARRVVFVDANDAAAFGEIEIRSVLRDRSECGESGEKGGGEHAPDTETAGAAPMSRSFAREPAAAAFTCSTSS